MFFLFAKPETKQTYQIYVGPGFNLATDLKAIRPVLDTMPMPKIDSVACLAREMDEELQRRRRLARTSRSQRTPAASFRSRSISANRTDLDPKSQCKPATFCEVKPGGACGCSLTASDPLALADPARKDSTGTKDFGGILGACEKSCSQWAVKDLDFPGKGPLGFSFKMPTNFAPDDKGWSASADTAGLSHDKGSESTAQPARSRLADDVRQYQGRPR